MVVNQQTRIFEIAINKQASSLLGKRLDSPRDRNLQLEISDAGLIVVAESWLIRSFLLFLI